MSVYNFQQGTMAGAAAAGGGYTIDQSIRFNDNDSANLSATLATGDGGGNKFTFSCWVKRANLGVDYMTLLSADATTDPYFFAFNSSDQLRFTRASGGSPTVTTTAAYRDVSSWYHVVLTVDTAEAAADRWKIYVNGTRQTTSVGGTPGTVTINTNVLHTIGRYAAGASNYFDGYLAEVYFIDNQALDPSSFGETNSTTGQWVPIKYAGSYGTNGFYITGADSADLGADESGNGNNFTSSGLTSADQVLDSPTDNQSTYNPIAGVTISSPEYSEGNTRVVNSSETGADNYRGTIGVSSGKWYVEFLITDVGAGENATVGVVDTETPVQNPLGAGNTPIGFSANSYAILPDGRKINNNSASAYGSSYTNGDVMGIALDMDNGAIWFSKNGTWQASATQSEIEAGTTTNAAFTGVTGTKHFASGFSAGVARSADVTMRPEEDWTGTCPSGFSALSTSNLPAPTIADPTAHFNTLLYTGNATTRSISGVGFQPDFVWLKGRSTVSVHGVWDAVRGASKYLVTNSNAAETTDTTNGLQAFETDGFEIGPVGTWNTNTATYVAWNWKANGTGSSNTDGSITSTVSANMTAGFSVLTFTGNGTQGATVGHGLGVAPKMVIVKARTTAGPDYGWFVYHAAVASDAETDHLILDTTAAVVDDHNSWDDTAPTSSVFSIGGPGGGGAGNFNITGDTLVAYCFAEVEGFSKFGSYVGTNGGFPFIYTGFRPAFVIVKSLSAGRSWVIMDNKRGATYNPVGEYLRPNDTSATGTTISFDFVSNGLKIRAPADTFYDIDASGQTFIYAAFAETPFKTALAR